jgi:predicted NBD/HSP70 family sugar kinase
MRSGDVAELRLAAHLLGELQAFPDADTADILDVRERLRDARVGFRAAMARAGRELADVPPDEFQAAADAYAREHVQPAVLGIREQLKELRAGPTLLRAVREPWAVPTVTSLAIATSMLDPGAVVGAGGSATAVALTARELLTRRGVRKQVRQQPFWYLREAGRALDERTRRSR